MKVIDEGHKFELATLDGGFPQTLTFVKRHDEENPMRFPGNYESYPGTTSQNVIRALLNRARYVNNQIWSIENLVIIASLRVALWMLEFRASRRHGKLYLRSLSHAETSDMCTKCGHTFCKHKKGPCDE